MKGKTFLCVLLSLVMIGSVTSPAYAAAASCSVYLEVEKHLTGDVPGAAEEFTFVLEPENNAPMPAEDSVTILGPGTGVFPPIAYTKPGNYHYTLREKSGSAAGYTYDDTVYHITVQVTTDDSGTLTATVSMSKDGAEGKAGAAEFVNHYTAPPGPEDPDPEDPDPEDPNPEDPNPEDPNPEDPNDTPQTGDITNLGLWIALSVTGLAGLLVTLLAFRKKKQQDEA